MRRLRRALAHEVHFARRALRNPRVIVRRWRRMSSAQKTFFETNHDPAKTLLLASSGRSGSTWLSEVLVESFSCRMIFEPLRRDRVLMSENVPWGCYLAPGDDDPEVRRVMARILSGRVRSPWTDKFNTYRFPRRRLVKEIRATNLLGWVGARFPRVPVVYLLRHPVATAWSAAQLGWDPFFGEFLDQRRLMDGPLAPWRPLIEEHAADDDLFHRHVLRWCMENLVPVTTLAPGSVHVVFYENLVEDPQGELKRLAAFLRRSGRGNWDFDARLAPTVDRPSAANYRQTPMMAAGERLESWVGVVPRPSVERALDLLRAFGLDRLYGDDVRPLVAADEVLQGPSPETGRPQPETAPGAGGAESSNSR